MKQFRLLENGKKLSDILLDIIYKKATFAVQISEKLINYLN